MYKKIKIYLDDLQHIALHKNILVILFIIQFVFLNNLKFVKSDKEFYQEPENADLLNEYMSSILYAEYQGSFKINIHVIKSNIYDGEFQIKLIGSQMLII